MGMFDLFRRPKPGGTEAMRARLEGAMAKRRLRGWQPPLENINSLVASGGPRLLARSRELVVTNGYAANACEAFASNLVGDGIKPSSLIEDPALRDRVQRLWLAWTDEADADGLTDFYGLQAMVAREMFVAGECFVRLRPRRVEDGLLVPLQLQLLQSEMLPFEKTETDPNGNRIRCGIEFDLIGRRVAYHFRRRHPGDSTDPGLSGEIVRVPASEVIHVIDPVEGGQLRGVSKLAPAIVKLFLLDQYDDAELDRKTPIDPGRVTARRLNRFEYSNSVRDLLGLDLNPGEDLRSAIEVAVRGADVGEGVGAVEAVRVRLYSLVAHPVDLGQAPGGDGDGLVGAFAAGAVLALAGLAAAAHHGPAPEFARQGVQVVVGPIGKVLPFDRLRENGGWGHGVDRPARPG